MEKNINKVILEKIQNDKESGDKMVYFPFDEEIFIDKDSELLQENDTIWWEQVPLRFVMKMEKRYSVKKQREIIMFLLMESSSYHRSHK